ncbi:MAG: hypothetical protein DMC60_05105 [Verrucomicrobia bacterium]|nr:MAG: hypothetical protein DMC60_05105 [Verrucomicrobiota bacterium]
MIWPLIRGIMLRGICISTLITSQPLKAYPVRILGPSNWSSSAVDAHGVRHSGRQYKGENSPWMDDAIKTVKPEYGYTERAHRVGGFGLYRVMLDLKTGAVTKVTLIQSTGVPALDDNAMKALHQWLWKPGRWKEVDVPIAFLPFNR